NQYGVSEYESFPTIAVAYIGFDSPNTILAKITGYDPDTGLPELSLVPPVGSVIYDEMNHCGCTFASENYDYHHIGLLCARGA
ncbi:MAG: hypothetical protein ACRC5A_15430, partial [Enterobacteriaceae bacterium]